MAQFGLPVMTFVTTWRAPIRSISARTARDQAEVARSGRRYNPLIRHGDGQSGSGSSSCVAAQRVLNTGHSIYSVICLRARRHLARRFAEPGPAINAMWEPAPGLNQAEDRRRVIPVLGGARRPRVHAQNVVRALEEAEAVQPVARTTGSNRPLHRMVLPFDLGLIWLIWR